MQFANLFNNKSICMEIYVLRLRRTIHSISSSHRTNSSNFLKKICRLFIHSLKLCPISIFVQFCPIFFSPLCWSFLFFNFLKKNFAQEIMKFRGNSIGNILSNQRHKFPLKSIGEIIIWLKKSLKKKRKKPIFQKCPLKKEKFEKILVVNCFRSNVSTPLPAIVTSPGAIDHSIR